MKKVRKQVTMVMSLDGAETVSFLDNYSVLIEHSNINHGKSEHEFDDFESGRAFFLQMIGALYLDGYR